ncbi:MAG: 2-dehydropantoate 2-reductase [Burkholderiaceae bacterium]
MRVAIVGAGGIGASLGAKLAAAGNEVSLVARGPHLAAIRERGLTLVDHVDGKGGNFRLAAVREPADLGPQDLIVIALKAYSIPAMAPKLLPLIAPGTVVLPAINGLPWWYFHRLSGPMEGRSLRTLDPRGDLFRWLDPAHVLGCVVHIAAELRAPGEVHHTGGRRLILGEPDNSDSPRLRAVCAALSQAGFEAQTSRDIRTDVWTKLIGNLSFNPVAALTGYLMNEICADAEVLEVIRAMMLEGMAVAEHLGVRIGMTPDQRIDLARQLGAAKISMLQDLENRRTLELDAIVGAVMELAEQAGIAVPTVRHVHGLTAARARALRISPAPQEQK